MKKYDPESFNLSIFFDKVKKKKNKEDLKNGKRDSKRMLNKNHTGR